MSKKETPKQLSEYDTWLLNMSRQDSNFIFHSDMSDYLFEWLLKYRFKRKFLNFDKKDDDDVFKDMLTAFKKACQYKARDNIINKLTGVIHEWHGDLDDSDGSEIDKEKEKECK